MLADEFRMPEQLSGRFLIANMVGWIINCTVVVTG